MFEHNICRFTLYCLIVAPRSIRFNPCIAQHVRVIGFDFHPSPYELLLALFPLLCSSCHFATPSRRQEGVKKSLIHAARKRKIE